METAPKPRSRHRRVRLLIATIALAFVLVLLAVYDVDIFGWFQQVWRNIRRVPAELVAIAIAFRLLEALFTARSWHNVLRATYPEEQIKYRTVLGAYQGGLAVNEVAPAQAGTFATLGIFRIVIPSSNVPSVLAAFVVHQLAFTFFGLLTYTLLFLAQPQAIHEVVDLVVAIWELLTARQNITIAVLIVSAVALAVGGFLLRQRIRRFRAQISPAASVFRPRKRYFLRVFLPASLAYACRWMVTGTFMYAFEVPVTPYTILLVLGSNSLAGLVRITPGGLGTQQALATVALRDYASADTVTAFSLTQDVITSGFNIAFGLLAMAWGFGISGTVNFLRNRRELVARGREPASEQ